MVALSWATQIGRLAKSRYCPKGQLVLKFQQCLAAQTQSRASFVGKAPRAKSGLGRALSLALPRARSRSLPAQANAACFGCYVGAGIAAGLIGGALIAGATAPAYAYAQLCCSRLRLADPTSVERLRLAISAGSSLLLSSVVRLNERPRVGPLFWQLGNPALIQQYFYRREE